MKKLSLILFMAIMAIPMMQAINIVEKGSAQQMFRTSDKAVAAKTFQVKHVNAQLRDVTEIPDGYAMVILAADDVWEDGSGYQMLLDADANAFGTIIPETGPLTQSGDADPAVYAEFEYKIPENADGACSTANMVCDDEAFVLIPAGVYDYCITNPTPGDRVWISSNGGTVNGRGDDFEFAAGATYMFMVTNGGYNDRVDLEVYDPNAPTVPENVTVDPAATTADVAWDDDHDSMWNLRYRPYNPNVAHSILWDVETDESLEGWMSYDYDGDGYSWGVTGYDDAYSGGNVFWSASYYNYSALDPDNWLISPEVPLNGTLSFMAASYSSYYPDNFAVFVTTGDPMDVDSYEMIGDFYTAPTEWTEYTFDLSEYEGAMGYFAIRHFYSEDEYYLFVDDVRLDVPGDEPAEWIYVYGIEDDPNYTIEGLTPETDYEVQVQAIAEDRRVSDWTNSVIFTTLAEEEPGDQTAAPGIVVTPDEMVYSVTITSQDPDADIYYRITYPDGTVTDWMLYEDALPFNENGIYTVEAYAIAPGKTESVHVSATFEVQVITGIDEMTAGKQVAGVRYFNMAGQEMSQANGMTIVVTTYTDGSTTATKVVK